jgi:hypothetical protein
LVVPVVFKDGIANRDAFIADISARIIAGGRNQLADDILTLVAKRTPQRLIGASSFQNAPPDIRERLYT